MVKEVLKNLKLLKLLHRLLLLNHRITKKLEIIEKNIAIQSSDDEEETQTIH